MKAFMGMVQLHSFLTLALDGGEQLASSPLAAFPARKTLVLVELDEAGRDINNLFLLGFEPCTFQPVTLLVLLYQQCYSSSHVPQEDFSFDELLILWKSCLSTKG